MHDGTPAAAGEPQPLPQPQSQPADASASPSFYDAVGGAVTFRAIAQAFYVGVRADAVLAPMYPEDDLDGAEERLMLFLSQYWGGPSDYSERRGHPRLRARHAAFHVNPDARDRWLHHMRAAVHEVALPPLYEATLLDYLERAAHAMVNTFEPTPEAEGRVERTSDAQD